MTHVTNPLYRPWAVLIVGLLFSIGWGIRGNYGHETGAMLPGALGAIGVSLLLQRVDWQRRVVYFAMFGMLGWAFGGSISYMMVIGYTHSGQAANQFYGYLMLFVIGFLWAALGGAGTALPAVLDQVTLRSMFRPLLYALVAWAIMYVALEPFQDWVDLRLLQRETLEGLSRQERPLYWLDTDWLEVSCVLLALMIGYFVEQRGVGLSRLAVHMAVGGVVFYGLFWLTGKTMGNEAWLGKLVQWQGVGGGRYADDRLAVSNWPALFLLLSQRTGVFYPGDTLSLWGGAVAGALVYGWRCMRLEFSLRLMIWMALGWWIGFLLLPVLGSLFCAEQGGLRMTPPRGDNWAGILGCTVAALVICWLHGYRSLVVASVVCGIWGGIGFSGAAWLEATLVSQGNPVLWLDNDAWKEWQTTPWQPTSEDAKLSYPPAFYEIKIPAPESLTEPNSESQAESVPDSTTETADEVTERVDAETTRKTDDETAAVARGSDHAPRDPREMTRWAHWHAQNWHSFLEQTYGFINGIAVLAGMAVLVRRTPPLADVESKRDWTFDVALFLALPVLLYVNLVKNLREWVSTDAAVPSALPQEMATPWIDLTLSTTTWFHLVFGAATFVFLAIQLQNRRRELAMLPATAMGRGQLLLLAILWAFVIGNFARALPGFSAPRLLTEGLIYLNALAATAFLLVYGVPGSSADSPGGGDASIEQASQVWSKRMLAVTVLGCVCLVAVPAAETWSIRQLYRDAPTGKRGFNYRFGPQANWRLAPLLQGQAHR